jgi:hypothetical protein
VIGNSQGRPRQNVAKIRRVGFICFTLTAGHSQDEHGLA